MKASTGFFLIAFIVWAPHMSRTEAAVWGAISIVAGYLAVWSEAD